MKYTFIACLGLALTIAGTGCKQDSRYVDPNSGRTLSLVKDANTGLMVDEDTKRPVYIYVDTETKDTINGSTGKVVNGQLAYVDGQYKIKSDEDQYKEKNGDFKMEREKDGDVTIKDGDTKVKIEGETGEKKVKHDD